jgi:hypothetical protein
MVRAAQRLGGWRCSPQCGSAEPKHWEWPPCGWQGVTKPAAAHPCNGTPDQEASKKCVVREYLLTQENPHGIVILKSQVTQE